MSRRVSEAPYAPQPSILAPPAVPSAFDDEFDASTLNPAWTRTGTFDDVTSIDVNSTFSGTIRSSLTYRRSWYMLQPGNGDFAVISKPVTLATNCFIWARASLTTRLASQTNNDGACVLSLSVGASFVNSVNMYLNEADANTTQAQFDTLTSNVVSVAGTTNNVGGANIAIGQSLHTVGILKIDTTYHGWVLSASGNWLWVASATHATSFTHVMLGAGVASAATPGNSIMGFDFFRYLAGSVLP